MKKIIVLGLFIVVVLLIGINLSTMSDIFSKEIVELNAVADFKVSEVTVEQSKYLHLTGLVFHSSMVVKEITTEIHGDELQVNVIAVFAQSKRSDRTGRIDYKVEIPSTIKKVTFGNERQVIWEINN